MSVAKESEYNGKPLLGLHRNSDDPLGFKFGLRKAQLILAHIDDIKAFVEKHTKTETATTGHAPDIARDLGA